MIRLIVNFSIFALTIATTNSLPRSICDIHDQISKTLRIPGLSSMRETDLQLMVCLAALHNYETNPVIKNDSSVGLFGLDPSMVDICESVELSFEDDDLSDEVSCYLMIREKTFPSPSHRVAPEDFCRDVSTEETTSFPIKYDRVMCADRAVIVPSENSKRLYRILLGQETNYTLNLKYNRFGTNVAYYDRNMYVNFFLSRTRRLWGKLNKTVNDLTNRPIRLTVLLLILSFILILTLRYLTTTLENLYINVDQKNDGDRNRSMHSYASS